MAHGQLAKNKTTISLVIPKDVKDELFTIATQENRSASSLIVTLVSNYISLYKNKEYLSQYNNLVYQLKNSKDDTV